MVEPQVHICPLCAAYVSVESGYDGPYYIPSCDHGQATEPAQVSVTVFRDPALLEAARSAACAVAWADEWALTKNIRRVRAGDTPGRRYLGPAGLSPAPERRDLTWTPADRKLRRRWRILGATTRFSETMKRVYLTKVQDALNQGSVFLAAVEQEVGEATISMHADINRTVVQ